MPEEIKQTTPPRGERIVAMVEFNGDLMVATCSGVYLLDQNNELRPLRWVVPPDDREG